MSEFRTITVSKGPGGYGGPLTITPDEKRNKVVYIVGGGQKPEVVDRIAELTGAEAVNGFNTRVPDDEHFCVVIDCGGSLRCGLYPKKGIPTINVVPTGKTGPLAQHIHEGIYVSAVGMDQVRPADADEAAGAQAAAAAESAQKSVPTREDGRPMKLTEQMATKQKKSLLEKIGLGAGKVIAVFYQGVSLDKISGILMNGYTATTGQEYVDKLLTKGGILNMGWVITMMFLSLAFVGVLEAYGTFHAILLKINKVISSRFSLVLTSAGSVLTVGMVAGEVYTSLVLPGRLMKSKYAEMGYDRSILSRTIEDWGTLVSPLIPWNNGGAFVTSTLGISAFLYAPFALFCWLSPLIGLIYAALGWFTPLDPKGPQKIEEEEMEDIADEVQDYMV